MSFSAGELALEIQKHLPDFKIAYKPDFRQAIADSWPMSIDDSLARAEWGWNPKFDLSKMTKDMIERLSKSPSPPLKGRFSYERKSEETNKYHGNLLLINDTPKIVQKQLAAALALQVSSIVKQK